jgi:acetyltransferase-like isoleucine patch superfamily enzyme
MKKIKAVLSNIRFYISLLRILVEKRGDVVVSLLPGGSETGKLRAQRLRHKGFDIGQDTIFDFGIHLGGAVRIGDFCSFNRNVFIVSTAPGKIVIGDYVIVGPNTVMRNANHRYDKPDTPIRYQGKNIGDIVIEDDVWISSNCVILAGAHIGKGSVIAAGAVVRSKIPPYSVAAGVPAKVIKQR